MVSKYDIDTNTWLIGLYHGARFYILGRVANI